MTTWHKTTNGLMIPFDEGIYKGIIKHKLNVLKKKGKWFVGIFGNSDTGKSTLASQIACVLDPKFNLDNIVWTTDGLKKLLIGSSPGQCFILDEAFSSFGSAAVRKKENLELKTLFMEARQLGCFIIVILPDLWSLDSFFPAAGLDTMFVCYKRKGSMQRGLACVYDSEGMKKAYYNGKKIRMYNVDGNRPRLRFKFSKAFGLNSQDSKDAHKSYEERKKKALIDKMKSESPEKDKISLSVKKLREQRAALVYLLKKRGMQLNEIFNELTSVGIAISNNVPSAAYRQGMQIFLAKELLLPAQNTP